MAQTCKDERHAVEGRKKGREQLGYFKKHNCLDVLHKTIF